jgi:oligopeptide transport system substrate-binding protein
MHITKDTIPSITLCYSNTSRNHKVAQAIQQQWNKTFNIEVKLENCEAQIFYDRIGRHDYQIAFGSWFADFHDPINFLEIFKYKNNKTNNTLWENPEFTQLLNISSTEFNHEIRKETLAKAEGILMQEMPVIPICFSSLNYVKSEDLLGVYFSDLGYLDFKYAFYENF